MDYEDIDVMTIIGSKYGDEGRSFDISDDDVGILWEQTTKQQRFEAAKVAMEGMLSRGGNKILEAATVARWSVEYADALLKELDK